MCIKHYIGWHCGHRDPEATVMKPEYCRRPYRYDHEPACDNCTYKVHVHVDLSRPRDSDFCPACREVRKEVWEDWAETYASWNREHIVPIREQNGTHSRIETCFKYVETRSRQAAVRLGPDHTYHHQYREAKNQILEPIKLQATRIRAANHTWNTRMSMARRDGQVPEDVLRVLEVQRKKQFDVTRMVAPSVSLLLGRQAQLFDQLMTEEQKVNNEEHAEDLSGENL
ncbi:hypothetical protein PG993_009366 [Apiospora rasikravindrae]|uniref:Uncharacterized protein n=1 Tax=Apiospora rasikravindrae TaxID=990691 RepID=A0ABR1SKH7_9PEZI